MNDGMVANSRSVGQVAISARADASITSAYARRRPAVERRREQLALAPVALPGEREHRVRSEHTAEVLLTDSRTSVGARNTSRASSGSATTTVDPNTGMSMVNTEPCRSIAATPARHGGSGRSRRRPARGGRADSGVSSHGAVGGRNAHGNPRLCAVAIAVTTMVRRRTTDVDGRRPTFTDLPDTLADMASDGSSALPSPREVAAPTTYAVDSSTPSRRPSSNVASGTRRSPTSCVSRTCPDARFYEHLGDKEQCFAAMLAPSVRGRCT